MKFKGLFAAMLVSMLVFSGCFGTPNPKKAIEKATDNLSEADSMSFDISFNMDVNASDGSTAYVDLSVEGAGDGSDEENPKFWMKAGGSFLEGETELGSGELEVRVTDKMGYFGLTKLEAGETEITEITEDGTETTTTIPNPLLAAYQPMIGQWFSIPIPEDELAKSDSEMSEEEKKVKELIEEADFWSEVELLEDDGTETSYKATFDETGFLEFIKKMAELSAGALSNDDLEGLKTFLDQADSEFTLRVEDESNMLSGINGTISGSDEEAGQNIDYEISFDLSFGNFNEAVEVEAPAGAQPFNPLMMMGAF